MTKYIFKAIRDKFRAHVGLVAALNGGMYLLKYKQQHNKPAIYPYCIFLPVSDVTEYTFSEVAENLLIQFSIWDDNDSTERILDAGVQLMTCFDFADLTISGHTDVCMMRESCDLLQMDEFYHLVITYRLEIQKARS